jgi:hypothetical protein
MNTDSAISILKKKMPEDEEFVKALEYLVPEIRLTRDEEIRKMLLGNFKGLNTLKSWGGISREEIIEWLENLGEQKPVQWNDVRFTSTIQVLEYAKSLDDFNQYGKDDIKMDIEWLKELKNQLKYRWKPREEDMLALGAVISGYSCSSSEHRILANLYDSLKKLR